MPGPAPSENARRRNKRSHEFVRLPESGRKGRAPKFPLSTKPKKGRAERWRALWRKPQAIMWQRLALEETVARYLDIVLLAESGNLNAAAEARQLEDRLGLNAKALKSHGWIITPDAEADVVQRPSKAKRKPQNVTQIDKYRNAGVF